MPSEQVASRSGGILLTASSAGRGCQSTAYTRSASSVIPSWVAQWAQQKEDSSVRLHSVANHCYPAVVAGGREGMDGALEAVEGVSLSFRSGYLERLVVLVSTYFTVRLDHIPTSHWLLPPF